MSDNIDLTVIAAALPAGSCLDPNIVVQIGKTRVLFPSNYSLFIKGSNTPSVEQRTYAWIKTSSLTGEIEGVFTWLPSYGLWGKRHFPSGVPTNERRIYVGSLTSLETYDGGESATVSDTTGPFWEEDTDFRDKLIAGVGPSTFTTVATDYNVYATGSADPKERSVYIIKPTGRIYDRSS